MPESKSAVAELIDLMREESIEQNGLTEYANSNNITEPVPAEANVTLVHATADLLEGCGPVGGPASVASALHALANSIEYAVRCDDEEDDSSDVELTLGSILDAIAG